MKEYNERWKKWYYAHKDVALAANRRYLEKNKTYLKDMRRRLRQEAIVAYGGQCECCSEKHWEFLTLDHPDGDGQRDRAKHRNITGQLYGWVKKNGYPKGLYRVLCMNCNWVRRYGGICPHTRP